MARFLIWLGGSLAVAVLVSTICVTLLFRTDVGRSILLDTAQSLAESQGWDISIGALKGALPFEIRLDDVALRDGDGEVLRLGEATLRLDAAALLKGRLAFETIGLRDLYISRLPSQTDPGPSDPTASGAGLPGIPISVRALSISPLTLGSSIAGEKVVLEVRLDTAMDPDAGINAGFTVTRLDGEGRIEGRLASDPAFSRLKASIKGESSQGGWISRLLGLPGEPAVKVALDGEGPIDGFIARYEIAAGKNLNTQGNIRLSTAAPLVLKIDGTAKLAAFVPAELRQAIAGDVSYGFRVELDREATLLKIVDLSLESGPISASGGVTLRFDTETIAANLSANLIDRSLLGKIVPGLAAHGGGIKLSATGPIFRPSLEAKFSLKDVAYIGNRAARIVARVSAAAAATIDGDASFLVTDLSIPDAPRGLVGGELKGQTHFGFAGDIVSLSDISVVAGPTKITGDASLNIASFRADFSVNIIDDGLDRVVAPFAEARLDSVMYGQFDGQLIALQIGGRIDNLRFRDPELARFALGSSEFWISSRQISTTEWKVSNFEVDAGYLKVSGEGTVDAGAFSGAMDLVAVINDLALLDPSNVLESGAATLAVTAQGSIDIADVRWELSATNLSARQISIPKLAGKGAFRWKGKKIAGKTAFSAETAVGPATATTKIAWDGQVLSLSDLEINRAADSIMGSLTVKPTFPAVDGALNLHVHRLSDWTAHAGLGLEGALSARVELSNDGTQQRIAWGAAITEVRMAGTVPLLVERVELTGVVNDLLGAPTIQSNTVVQGVRRGNARFASLELNTKGPLSKFGIDLRGKGAVNGHDIRLDVAGVSSLVDGVTIGLDKLEIFIANNLVSLTKPSRATVAEGRKSLDLLSLSLFSGQLRLFGEFGGERIAAGLEIEKIALRPVADLFGWKVSAGQLDAKGSISGPLRSPSGRLDLTLKDVKALGDHGAELPPATLEITARMDNGILDSRISLSGVGEVPLVATLITRVPVPGASIPVAARLNWHGDLDDLVPFLPFDGNQFSGDTSITLSFDGDFDTAAGIFKPTLTEGRISLEKGRFENFVSGAVLDPVNAEVVLDGTRLDIRRLEAGDTGAGTLRVFGSLDLAEPAVPIVTLDAVMHAMTVVRRDDAEVQLDGQMAMRSNGGRLKVSGEITNRSSEIRLIGGLPTEITVLEVEEVRSGVVVNGAPESGQKVANGPPLDLDVKFSAPGRIFVRGRGLDSEWGGNLHVLGTPDIPALVGTIAPLRGGFEFAGRRFDLGKSGGVTFTKDETIEPTLNLSATHTATGFVAMVSVTGSPGRPEVVLTSDPSYPEDEILAKILFGKFAARLSAAEALQLAQSTRTLLSGEPGTLDKIRGAIGVDVLTFAPGGDDSELGRLKAGKYIRNDVFLGVEQGTAPGSTRSVVEWNVTPKITVEGTVGSSSESSLGIQRRWEY